MLSVMVILLSEMNSYRIRVAIAVLSPSSAPCLVLALKKQVHKHSLVLLYRILYLAKLAHEKTAYSFLKVIL